MSEIDTSRENVEEITGDLDGVGRPGIARKATRAALASITEAAEARDARIRDEAKRELVEDAMALLHMAPRDDETTMDALRRLIDAEQAVALDPAVSAEARALIERGRRAGIEDAARVVDGGSFLHADAPDARFARQAATAIRDLLDKPAGEDGR